MLCPPDASRQTRLFAIRTHLMWASAARKENAGTRPASSGTDRKASAGPGRAHHASDLHLAVGTPHQPVAHAVVGLEDQCDAVAFVRQQHATALRVPGRVEHLLAGFPDLEHVARLETVLRAA